MIYKDHIILFNVPNWINKILKLIFEVFNFHRIHRNSSSREANYEREGKLFKNGNSKSVYKTNNNIH